MNRIKNSPAAVAAGTRVTTKARMPLAFLLVAAAVCAATAGAALATTGSGASGFLKARLAFADPTDLKFKVTTSRGQEVINVHNAQETAVQQITIGPGGHTGWHSHPGPVVVLVKGELTLYSADDPTCTGRTYKNEAFIDSGQGHVHIARNESGQSTELWVTYFDVPAGQSFRDDAPDPGICNF
jgi:hypothetical protein